MDVIEQRQKMLQIENEKEFHNYFLVYYGVHQPTFGTVWNPQQPLHNSLAAVNNNQENSVYSGKGYNSHCYVGQLVKAKPYEPGDYETKYLDTYLEQDEKRIVSECDILQLRNLFFGNPEEISSIHGVTSFIKEMIDSDNIHEVQRVLDFSYISVDGSDKNRGLFVARGFGKGTCFPLWFGQDRNMNFFFTNHLGILEQYCPKTYEFPKGCHATIDAAGKIQFFDSKYGIKLDLGEEDFRGQEEFRRGMTRPVTGSENKE